MIINNSSKIVQWIKLVFYTGGMQLIIQLVGLFSGIIVIRLLPTSQYAWYTIANTMLGTLIVLSDGGISTGVLAQSSKVWQDRTKLGVVISTGMDLRLKFSIGSLIFSIPVLLYLLIHQNASYLNAMLITIAVIPPFYAALSDNLLEIPIKLHQNIIALQKNQVYTAFGRLLLIGFSLLIFPFSFVALLGNGIPRIWANVQLRKIIKPYSIQTKKTDKQVQKDILSLVYRLLPGAIYYSLSGQISIWLLSFFGKANSVAQIGAFGRISMMLSLFTIMVNTLIVPRFTRTINNSKMLLRRLFQIQVGSILIFSVIIFFSYSFSEQLLWVIGKNYSTLNHELVLSIISTSIGILAGITFSLYTAKGWAIYPFVYVPINIVSLILGAFFFKVDSIQGVLYLSIFTASVQYIMNILFLFIKIIKVN